MSDNKIELSFAKLEKALGALKEMLDSPMQTNRGNIDAAIQRFEFTFELFWKLLKRILESKGVEAVFPKDVLKAAYAGYLIGDEAIWLEMLKDRNLSSHTYDEKLADQIYQHLQQYYPILKKSFDKLAAQYRA